MNIPMFDMRGRSDTGEYQGPVVKFVGGSIFINGAAWQAAATAIASAATVDLATATGDFLDITGTTTITSFGAGAVKGARRFVRFTGILNITPSATLVAPTSMYVGQNGVALMIALGPTAGWQMAAYFPQSTVINEHGIRSMQIIGCAEENVDYGSEATWMTFEGFFADAGAGHYYGLPASTGTLAAVFPYFMKFVVNLTPTGDCTINHANGGYASAAEVTFMIFTSGTTSRTITFGTNFKSQGTLATGTVSGKWFTVTFVCGTDGLTWVEKCRTPAM